MATKAKTKKGTRSTTPKASTGKVKAKGTSTKSKKVKNPEANLDSKNAKSTVKMAVESKREIKYKYPEDIHEPLDRKKWRQQTRSKLTKLEADVTKAKESGKGIKKAESNLISFRKEVLLVP